MATGAFRFRWGVSKGGGWLHFTQSYREFLPGTAPPPVFLKVQHQEQAKLVNERLGHLDDFEAHNGQLSHRTYVSRLDALDTVLLPHMPARFAVRSSGIFANAVAYGLVTVVPDNSWTSDQLAAGHGSGVTFGEVTVDANAQALIQVSDEFTGLQEKAMSHRSAWRAAQSLDVLLYKVLGQVASFR